VSSGIASPSGNRRFLSRLVEKERARPRAGRRGTPFLGAEKEVESRLRFVNLELFVNLTENVR
jgi:hypothetical protein